MPSKWRNTRAEEIQVFKTTCKLCREEKEDIVHFTIKCKKLEEVRDYDMIDKNIKNTEEKMRILLFRNKNHMLVGRLMRRLWDLRKKLLKQEEKKNPNLQVTSARRNKKNKNGKNTAVAV